MKDMVTAAKRLLRGGVFVVVSVLRIFVKTKRGRWVIAGDRTDEIEPNAYAFLAFLEGSFVKENVCFISRRGRILKTLERRGTRAYHNYSIKGIYMCLTAEVYIYSLSPSDAMYVSPRRTLFVNLTHGALFKKILYDATNSSIMPSSAIARRGRFEPVVTPCEAHLTLTTSNYLAEFTRSAFRVRDVLPTGFPRNDVLVKRRKDLSYIDGIKSRINCNQKLLVTYLPTHRRGGGWTPPILFEDRIDEIVKCYGDRVAFFTKQHPLSATENFGNVGGAVFSVREPIVSTQDLLLATDILITDYSSVFIDYLLLRRPVYFYFYDWDLVNKDDFYYLDRNCLPGPVAYDAETLFSMISERINASNSPSVCDVELFERFHSHDDDKSSERVYFEIERAIKHGSYLNSRV